MIVSYAQNFEDVILMRALSGIERGCYIDVGAAWPDQHSVTKAFYEKGWSGINIEPNPIFLNLLKQKRVRDINIGAAAGRVLGSLQINFFKDTGLSTFVDEIAEKNIASGFSSVRSEVPVTTLEAIWTLHVPPGQDVHFLKVDVEGFEQAVLEGNNWLKNRPWIVLVEATLPLTQIESYTEWEIILLNSDYEFIYADGLNRFYVAKERYHLIPAFKYPPNVFDDFKSCAEVELENKVQQLENTVKQLTGNIAILERRNVNSEREILNLRQSFSWRLTSPLRWSGRLVVDCFWGVRQFANKLAQDSINNSENILSLLMVAVLKRPELSNRINKFLTYCPRLHGYLVSIAKRCGVLADMQGGRVFTVRHHEKIPLESNDLTPRARLIYSQLVRITSVSEEIR